MSNWQGRTLRNCVRMRSHDTSDLSEEAATIAFRIAIAVTEIHYTGKLTQGRISDYIERGNRNEVITGFQELQDLGYLIIEGDIFTYTDSGIDRFFENC